jgi:hypothetical protein
MRTYQKIGQNMESLSEGYSASWTRNFKDIAAFGA